MSKIKIKRIGEDGNIYTYGDINSNVKGGIDESQIQEFLKPYATVTALNDTVKRVATLESKSFNSTLLKAIRTIIPTKETDSEYWVSCSTPLYQTDPAGYYVNAAKVCNQGSGWGHSYDLILGDYDDNEGTEHSNSYIKIANINTVNDAGKKSQGNIRMCSLGSVLINSEEGVKIKDDNTVCISTDYGELVIGKNDGSDYYIPVIQLNNSDGDFLVLGNGSSATTKIRLGNNNNAYKYNYNSSDNLITISPNLQLCAYQDTSSTYTSWYAKFNPYEFKFRSTYDACTNIKDKPAAYSPDIQSLMEIKGVNDINPTPKCEFMQSVEHGDEFSFIIELDRVYAFSDQFQVKKDTEIRFKTSSNNSMRLTEGEGFKIFTNLYATQDHVTDISEFTEDEQAILKTNTVQKLLLQFNKRITELENKLKQS